MTATQLYTWGMEGFCCTVVLNSNLIRTDCLGGASACVAHANNQEAKGKVLQPWRQYHIGIAEGTPGISCGTRCPSKRKLEVHQATSSSSRLRRTERKVRLGFVCARRDRFMKACSVGNNSNNQQHRQTKGAEGTHEHVKT